MPVTRQFAYFDHAAVAPLPQRTRDTIARWLVEATELGDTVWPQWAGKLEQLRQTSAGMIGASVDEIALIPNTTAGITLVAEGYPWRPGDSVVTLANEFPSNVYPWLNLADRGVEVRRVETDGVVDLQRLADACDATTRIISVSWVGYASGYRLDLEAISQLAQDRGSLLFLDAIQGLGIYPLDVRRHKIDFLAADGHKWLLGPEGAGIFYLRREHLNLLRPLGVGWNSVVQRYDFSQIGLNLRDVAARYEGGSMNMAGFHGLAASIEWLHELGTGPTVSAVGDRVLEVSRWACDALAAAGVEIISPRVEHHDSGIVVFRVPGNTAEEVRARCRDTGVVVSCRGGGVRISVHAYNNEEDIERLVKCLTD
jgi:selenocysteine lyase/cysteine desulfurase